jgi:MGT family glycosyltransferase
MSTFVFINIPAHGHINPTLPIVTELTGRGHRVYYLTGESFAAIIQKAGGIPISLSGSWQRRNTAPPGDREIALLPFLMAQKAPRIVPELIDRLRSINPDCIIFNTMLLWVKLAAKILRLPAIGFRPFHSSGRTRNVAGPFTNPELELLSQRANQALDEVTASYHVTPISLQDLVSEIPDLTLVFLPKSFQADAEQFDRRFLFVGPSFIEPQAISWPVPKNGKLPAINVYISLGTLRNNTPDFYRMCFSAFSGPQWSVVMSVGDQIDLSVLAPIPGNFLVKRSVPQTALLPQVDVFVSHGGLNSTMESLFYGVPLVILPAIKEQVITAERVQDLHLGIVLDHSTVTYKILREAVVTAFQSNLIKDSVFDMMATVRNAGGYLRAANAITAAIL